MLGLLIQNLRRWRHCKLTGPGRAAYWGWNPRFDEIVEKCTDYLDDRSVLGANPAKVDLTLGARGHKHFDNSDARVAATSQMIHDALRWPRAASVLQREVGRAATELQADSGSSLVARSPSNPCEGGRSASTRLVSSRRG